MIDNKTLDELARKLGELLPESVQNAQKDIEKNIKTGLSSAFQRMDLVTREEFEVQTALLERTRERLNALEIRVRALEKELLGPRAEGDEGSNP